MKNGISLICVCFLFITSVTAQQKITFNCDQVTAATEKLEETPIKNAIDIFSQRTSEGCRSESQVANLVVAEFNPFVYALHKAYADHRPIALSPDMIWTLIAQGLAIHIKENSDTLRNKLVAFQGKEKIIIDTDPFGVFTKGNPSNPWHKVVSAFADSIKAKASERVYNDVVQKFSTTRPEATTAYQISLMSGMSNYFDYEARTLCGITSITLEGSTKDWKKILKATKALEFYGLKNWADALEPILKQFIAASKGKIDEEFWQEIYKVHGGSGGPYITGWVIKLFPYTGKTKFEKNPFIDREPESIFDGLTTKRIPSGLSTAPFKWKCNSDEYKMEFVGGFVGVKQDPVTLCLRPEIGWFVCEEPRKTMIP